MGLRRRTRQTTDSESKGRHLGQFDSGRNQQLAVHVMDFELSSFLLLLLSY